MNKNLLLFLLLLLTKYGYSADYYWVGGTGNWSDYANHWATSSGGSIFHTQVPTLNDDVYFDANSFTASGQTVTNDQTIIYCRDMNWTGVTNNPSFAGPSSNELKIYGSIIFSTGMNMTYSGKIYFEATTPGHIITMAGKSFSQYIYFNGIGGEWSMQDAFQSNSWVNLVHGTVSTNNNNVTVGAFYASSNNPMTLNLGASLVTITGSTWAWWVNNSQFTLNAGTSIIRLTSSSSPDIRYANNLRFHDVEFTNPNTTAEIISSNNSTFNTVTFRGHGVISGNHTYSTLNFSAGKNYELKNGNTQTVTNFNASGNCTSYIIIKSTSAGAQANIQKISGSLVLEYVQLKDLNATGGAVFTANNAVDLGNNTGWILNVTSSRNLYWVGGSGDWTDANHWSLTSGGSGPQCPPTFQDNVFFDAGSFTTTGQVVNIDATAFCRDMNWTGVTNNPSFSGPSTNDLNIYGSLTFASAMNRNYSGKTWFEATSSGHTITMAGQSFNQYIYFNGIGGEWTMLDDFQSSSWVNLVHGTVNTNSNNVTVGAFYASANNLMTLNLGASLVTITGSTWAWWVNNSLFTLNAGTSLIRLTSSGSPDIRYANNLNFYDVEFTNPNTTADITSSNNSTFNSVTFLGHGIINGNHTYNTLNFTAGKTYELKNANTQTVTTLNANGNCTSYITIKSTSPGAQANIQKSSGNMVLDFVQLQDLNTTGGATFTANNAVDLGNNTGWTINVSVARNLYWIGGTGNWTDANHWSLTSGGSGPQCPPTFQDNVFFDANSFSAVGQTVSIDANAYCRDMDWTGVSNNPSLVGPSANELRIYGSLSFATAMSLTYNGEIYFEATSPGHKITMAGKSFIQDIYFNGIGGEWSILDNFQSSSWVNLVHGTVNTNSNNVTVGAFYASANNPMTLNLGASLVTITGSTWAWWVNNSLFTLDAGTSLIRLTSSGSPDIRYANNLTFYDVEFTNPNTTAEIRSSNNSVFNSVIFYGDGVVNGNHTFGDFTLSPGRTYTFQANTTQTFINNFNAIGTGGFPIEIQSNTAGVQANFFKASGIVCAEYLFLRDNNATGGASWYAVNSTDNGNTTGWIFGPCALLSVDLIKFDGYANGLNNKLFWQTASETNNDYFELEKSKNAIDWSMLAVIDGAGNSNTVQNYLYLDEDPYDHTYYRLKLVDYDGKSSYTNVISIQKSDMEGFSEIAAYPNPMNDRLNILLPEGYFGSSPLSIKLYNGLGQIVRDETLIPSGKRQLIKIETVDLPESMYYMILQQGSLIYSKELHVKH